MRFYKTVRPIPESLKKDIFQKQAEEDAKVDNYKLSTLTDTPLLRIIEWYNKLAARSGNEFLTFKIKDRGIKSSMGRIYLHGMLYIGNQPFIGYPLLPTHVSEERVHEGILEIFILQRMMIIIRKKQMNWFQRLVCRVFKIDY